jgi:hypothetical protein
MRHLVKTQLVSIVLLTLAIPTVPAAEIADSVVDKTLGVAGVRHVTTTQTKYGNTYSDVEYQDAKGKYLMVLRLGTSEQYAMWKQMAGPQVLPVAGVGEEAFELNMMKSVCAKAGKSAACVTPANFADGTKITDAQVLALLKAAL